MLRPTFVEFGGRRRGSVESDGRFFALKILEYVPWGLR